jgi:protein SCO1/2
MDRLRPVRWALAITLVAATILATFAPIASAGATGTFLVLYKGTAVPAKIRQATYVVFVTTDVKHDTGPVIAAWLRHFDPGLPRPFVGLTGSQAQIDAAQASAHVQLAEDDGQLHAADVVLYGADDYAHVKYLQSDNESDQISHDLQLVAE